MGRYRKVSVQIWGDRKVRAMTDKAQLVFIFILTHPQMTSLGAMRASIEGLAAESWWDIKVFRKVFLEVIAKGLLEYDEEHCLIIAPNFLKHNPPESHNVIKSWASVVELLPECQLLDAQISRVVDLLEGKGDSFVKVMPKTFRKVYPIPEQEQEPEQEQDKYPSDPRKRGNSSLPDLPDDLAGLKAEWDSYVAHRQDMPKPKRLTARACELAFEKLRGWGVDAGRESLSNAVVGGYQGIFEPNGRGASGARGSARQGPPPSKRKDWDFDS